MTEYATRLRRLVTTRDDRGAAMAEYGLLLVLVVLGAMAIMSTFGETLAETIGFAAETFNESPALAQEAIE